MAPFIRYNADCRLVNFNRLFRPEVPNDPTGSADPVANDVFHVIEDWLEQSKVNPGHLPKSLPKLFQYHKRWTTVVPKNITEYLGGGKEHKQQGLVAVDGFSLLESHKIMEDDLLGYKVHLECMRAIAKLQQRQASLAGEAAATRSAQHGARLPKQPKARWKDFLVPSWTDLMMWAVLVGQEDLAWLLWKKTTMPMRSALMASRVMDRIANADPDDSVDTEQARRYERWAIETLGRVRDRKAAMDLLTFVQKKKVAKVAMDSEDGRPDGRDLAHPGPVSPLPVWRDSVMDQACASEPYCRDYVAAPHCQYLRDQYYHGNFSGSAVCISERTGTLALLLQIDIMLLHLLTLGLLRDVVRDVVPIVDRGADTREEADEDEGQDNDKDWDLEYFEGSHLESSSTRRRRHASDHERRGGRSYLEFWIRWKGFMDIPRVKFMFHTLFYIVYIGLYLALLPVGGTDGRWSWSVHESTLYTPILVSINEIEICIWLYMLGRLLEEINQILMSKDLLNYLSDFWNLLDWVSLGLMTPALVLRILVAVDGWQAELAAPMGAKVTTCSPERCPGYLGLGDETIDWMMQCIQVAFSLSAMVVIIRFLDTLTVFASLSLLIEMLLEMMRSSLMIVVVFMITSIGFGTAFAGLMPQGQNDENVFARPFWISFRTMVGDFDILQAYELNGDSYSRGRVRPVSTACTCSPQRPPPFPTGTSSTATHTRAGGTSWAMSSSSSSGCTPSSRPSTSSTCSSLR